MQVERKVGSSSTPGLAPPTPPQPKEGQRGAAGHTTQPKQQLSPAFQRHVMPCTAKPVAQASTAHPQQTRRSGSPARQWQQEAPLPQTQQHSSKKTAVLDSVLHQPGCELDQRCNAEDGLDGGRWQPSVRYCLTSAEPAMGAGVWEEQATRYSCISTCDICATIIRKPCQGHPNVMTGAEHHMLRLTQLLCKCAPLYIAFLSCLSARHKIPRETVRCS